MEDFRGVSCVAVHGVWFGRTPPHDGAMPMSRLHARDIMLAASLKPSWYASLNVTGLTREPGRRCWQSMECHEHGIPIDYGATTRDMA